MVVRHTVVFLWFVWMIFGVPAVLFYTLFLGSIVLSVVWFHQQVFWSGARAEALDRADMERKASS